MKKYIYKLSGIIASLAMAVTVFNVNATCVMYIHQPKLPENAKKLRKF